MNKKGEMNLYVIVMIFIAAILGLSLIGSIANGQATLTTLQTTTNSTVTFPANGSTLTLNGQKLVDGTFSTRFANGTGGVVAEAGNYTLTDLTQSGGSYRAILTVYNPTYADKSMNVSYQYQPVGYNESSGGRGIANIITLFFAFIILATVLIGVREWIAKK